MLLASNENGVRVTATPGTIASCPFCGREMISKCGSIKVWHWAHKQNNVDCRYGAGETEWHLSLKKYAYDRGCEVEKPIGKNIADIYIRSLNKVIELQNSSISIDEIIERSTNLVRKMVLDAPLTYDKGIYHRPVVDWIFNMKEKYETSYFDRWGQEQGHLVIYQNEKNLQLMNIYELWRRKTTEVLFNRQGYPKFGKVYYDVGDAIVEYKRIFSNRSGYGHLVTIDKIIPLVKEDIP